MKRTAQQVPMPTPIARKLHRGMRMAETLVSRVCRPARPCTDELRTSVHLEFNLPAIEDEHIHRNAPSSEYYGLTPVHAVSDRPPMLRTPLQRPGSLRSGDPAPKRRSVPPGAGLLIRQRTGISNLRHGLMKNLDNRTGLNYKIASKSDLSFPPGQSG
jgi:hypothetical protein